MAVDQVGPSASEAQRMNNSRDVTLCKKPASASRWATPAGKKRFDLDDRLQDAMR
jgi:hypothetical protein